MKKLNFEDPRFFNKLERFATDVSEDARIKEIVAGILSDVRSNGDRAIIELTEKFDGFRCTPKKLRIDPFHQDGR